jgi:hypothetical protein
MTWQYLAGELSQILGELETAATDESTAREVARLRRAAETRPPSTLAPMVRQALVMIDRMCLDSLTRGEATAFTREVMIGAELWEFGVCAGFLDEGQTRTTAGLR